MLAVLAVLCTAWGAGGWWPVFPLLWFVLIWGAIFFFGFRWRRGWYRGRGGSAEDVLSERYARGEIDAREYRERLEVLKERGS